MFKEVENVPMDKLITIFISFTNIRNQDFKALMKMNTPVLKNFQIICTNITPDASKLLKKKLSPCLS